MTLLDRRRKFSTSSRLAKTSGRLRQKRKVGKHLGNSTYIYIYICLQGVFYGFGVFHKKFRDQGFRELGFRDFKAWVYSFSQQLKLTLKPYKS